MGGKGGGSAQTPYQQSFSGKDYETSSAEMDKLQADLWAREQVTGEQWSKGDRPPEAEKATPKKPVPGIPSGLPDAGMPPPLPKKLVTTQGQYPTGNMSGLGDALVSGLTNPNLAGQV